MADNGSFFSLEVFPGGWFAPETQGQGWFDKEFLDPASSGPVDHAASGSTSLTFTVSGNTTADKSASGSTGLTFATSGTATADRPASGTTGITFAATGAATADRAASGSTSLTFTVTGSATHDGQQTPLAVIETDGYRKKKSDADKKRKDWETDLRRIIDNVLDDREPEQATQVEAAAVKRKVKAQARVEQIAFNDRDLTKLVDELLALYVQRELDEEEEEAMFLLAMAA